MSNPFSHSHYLPTRTGLTGEGAAGSNGASHIDVSSSQLEAPDAPPAAPTGRKHKSSKAKGGKHISRSFSTPQLRDTTMSDSDSDKKRNKLGYQRISIACSHCRRRKIRCIIADGATQQRCQNCIRLKKECVFYPVDQQAAMESQSDQSGGTMVPGSGPSSVVSSSPPNQGERTLEPARDFPAFAPIPSNAPSSYEGLPLEPGSALLGHGPSRFATPHALAGPDSRLGGFIHPDETYRSTNDTRSWSASASLERPSTRLQSGHSEGPSQPLPQYTDSPNPNVDYAPFPTHEPMRMPGQLQHTQGFGYDEGGGLVWQQPQPSRNITYGQINHLQDHATSYQQVFQPGLRQQPPPGQYLHPLEMQNSAMLHDPNGPHSAPIQPSALHPVYGQPPNPFMFHQPHTSGDNASHARAQTYPTGWYPDHNTYEAIREDSEGHDSRAG